MNNNASILIVEDELFSAQFLQETLSAEGFRICDMVATGEDAVTAAREKKPDVILMDIQLAGEINGIEAARRIKRNAEIAIIFTTGFASREKYIEAQDTMPAAFLTKPINIPNLCSIIKSLPEILTVHENKNNL